MSQCIEVFETLKYCKSCLYRLERHCIAMLGMRDLEKIAPKLFAIMKYMFVSSLIKS